MKAISLTKGKVTLVNDKDYAYLSQWNWHCTYYGYAARRQGKDIIMMHRVVNDTPEDMFTDHINGDKLYNQRDNLRNCNTSQNMMNIGLKSNNKSGYKGVTWSNQNKKWYACIRVNGKSISLGFYDDIIVAAKAYKKGAAKYFGEFARV